MTVKDTQNPVDGKQTVVLFSGRSSSKYRSISLHEFEEYINEVSYQLLITKFRRTSPKEKDNMMTNQVAWIRAIHVVSILFEALPEFIRSRICEHERFVNGIEDPEGGNFTAFLTKLPGNNGPDPLIEKLQRQYPSIKLPIQLPATHLHPVGRFYTRQTCLEHHQPLGPAADQPGYTDQDATDAEVEADEEDNHVLSMDSLTDHTGKSRMHDASINDVISERPPKPEPQAKSAFSLDGFGNDIHHKARELEQSPLSTIKPPKTSQAEITAEDLLNRNVELIPCLIEPIFQRVGLAAVAGSSDVGKSAFLRQFAWAVATKSTEFLGWPIKAKYHSSIYVSTEDDENATAFLLYSLNKSQCKQTGDCSRLRFVFETHDLLNELDRRLSSQPADLVVIDAFGDLYTGDANKTNQIRQFLHDYSQLAQKHGCLILWLHHTGKRTDEEAPSKHHVIGGQGFEGKMRLLIELRRDHHDNLLRHLCIVKGNYLPDNLKDESFVLTFQDFTFRATNDRVPFAQLARPKEQPDEGRTKYNQIQELRQQGFKGDVLAEKLGWSKSYISKIEGKYGSKANSGPEVS